MPDESWCLDPAELDENRCRSADTVVFLDVDGVLNVGVRDGDDLPLMLDHAGLANALKLWGKHEQHPMRDGIERLVSMSRRSLEHGETATYTKLASNNDTALSDVLIGRLVNLIRVAGKDCLVVLSSKWRVYKERTKRLEKVISKTMGEPFQFAAKTATEEATTPETRLRAIGDFMKGLCSWRGTQGGNLRVLVLEDFHITAMDGWSCDGSRMATVEAAEQYIQQKAGPGADVSVKIIHTYDEWQTPRGLRVQVGTGLQLQHCCNAARFLGSASCRHCEPSGRGRPAGWCMWCGLV